MEWVKDALLGEVEAHSGASGCLSGQLLGVHDVPVWVDDEFVVDVGDYTPATGAADIHEGVDVAALDFLKEELNDGGTWVRAPATGVPDTGARIPTGRSRAVLSQSLTGVTVDLWEGLLVDSAERLVELTVRRGHTPGLCPLPHERSQERLLVSSPLQLRVQGEEPLQVVHEPGQFKATGYRQKDGGVRVLDVQGREPLHVVVAQHSGAPGVVGHTSEGASSPGPTVENLARAGVHSVYRVRPESLVRSAQGVLTATPTTLLTRRIPTMLGGPPLPVLLHQRLHTGVGDFRHGELEVGESGDPLTKGVACGVGVVPSVARKHEGQRGLLEDRPPGGPTKPTAYSLRNLQNVGAYAAVREEPRDGGGEPRGSGLTATSLSEVLDTGVYGGNTQGVACGIQGTNRSPVADYCRALLLSALDGSRG